MNLLTRLTAAVFLLASSALFAAEATAPDYVRDVSPIFKTYCTGCHNPADHEGKLSLEQYDQLLRGGKHGAVVVPGKADQSRLLLVLTGKAKPAMPPEDNDKPTAKEIALLEAWIVAGAKGPQGAQPDPRALVTPAIKPLAPVREAVSAVAYSPDGNRIAVGRYGVVELLSGADRSPMGKLEGHRGRVNALSFSGDSMQLLVAAGEAGMFGQATLWNAASGSLTRTFEGHQDSLYAAVLSPDGKIVATSSYDQQIKLWDASTGKELRTLVGHNDAVYDVAFRPDGKILASASGDRTVKLWNVATGERLDTFSQPLKELYCIAFSPDGKRLAAGGLDNRVRVWQISSDGKENTNPLVYSRFAHEAAVIKLAYSPDGRTLVSAGEDRTIKLWQADTMVERALLERQPDWVPALAISPDNKTLLVGRMDGSLAFYSLGSGKTAPTPPLAKATIEDISIRGVQRGIANRLKLTGKHLLAVSEVKTSDPRLVARFTSPARSASEVEVEVTPDASLARGRFEIWLTSAAGEGNRFAIHVDTLPQQAEVEPNNTFDEAKPTGLPVSIWGTLGMTGDVDSYAIDAKAGQTIVAEVLAGSIGSKLNQLTSGPLPSVARLTLLDPNRQSVIGAVDYNSGRDPVVAFPINVDGRYVLQINDLSLGGSSDHFYRLAIGTYAYATGIFPLSIPAHKSTDVEITGFNLPPSLKVKMNAGDSGEMTLPLDPKAYRSRRELVVRVGTLPETIESEPNNDPAKATPIPVPGTVGGRIWSGNVSAGAPDSGDVDLFRFETAKGKTWIIETEAANRGSPVDTVIEVLHADGRPVERLVLQAVRDSEVTFRPIDATQTDCRVLNWEEMQLNEYLYLNGEVVKLFRSPQGPDSGFMFYEGDNFARRCYFDTTATAHAMDEPCYIVVPHAPGTRVVGTGLPVFPLYYMNDDEQTRKLGRDSRLTFTAPADGTYLIRVRDARGESGPRYAYRLAVRDPRPDFNVALSGANPTIGPGGGKLFTLTADRLDGFDGEIRFDISGLPAGFRVSSPLTIQAGHREALGVLFAESNAPKPSEAEASQSLVKARAIINGQEVVKTINNFGRIHLGPKAKLFVRMEPQEIEIEPGTTVKAKLRVELNGHKELVTFAVRNLPHGVIVDNLGLNGVTLPKGQLEREIFLTADPWVPESTRAAFAVTLQPSSAEASPPVLIHIRKKTTVAQAK